MSDNYLMLEIDGSYLEGGGQILRTACALSAVTGRPCRVYNIRKGRDKPGLRTQHLMGLEALARYCGGRLEGGRIGSIEITFIPGYRRERNLAVAIPTAGSITLVLQTLTIAAAAGPEPLSVSFNGGATDTFFSPAMDYFVHVFGRMLGMLGAKIDVQVHRRGYYPRGGAEAAFKIYPAKLKPLSMTERGCLERVTIHSGASETLRAGRVAERQAEGARLALGGVGVTVEEQIGYHKSYSSGSSICIVAVYSNTVLGFDGLGERGKQAEAVGREAALGLLREMESGACVDRHLSDQIVPFMVLAGADGAFTTSEVTNHLRTNIWVTEKFMGGSFWVDGNTVKYFSPR